MATKLPTAHAEPIRHCAVPDQIRTLRRHVRRPGREGFAPLPREGTRLRPRGPALVRASSTLAPTPTAARALTAQQAHDDLLDLTDVHGKRIVSTRLRGNVTVREENATAALKVMSRFAVDPKWLVYLPPTAAGARPGVTARGSEPRRAQSLARVIAHHTRLPDDQIGPDAHRERSRHGPGSFGGGTRAARR